MPRYRPETAEAKAKSLTKSYIQSGCNQSRLAKKEGVTSQAICQRFKHTPGAKQTLQEIIDRNLKRAGISQAKVYRRLDEQLDATRTISAVVSPDGKDRDADGQTCDFIKVEDYNARDKAIDKSLMLMGHIKHAVKNGNGQIIINNVVQFYRPEHRPAKTVDSESRPAGRSV